MRRAIWWVALAAYACWVLSPWGWVDLVSVLGLGLGAGVTHGAVAPTWQGEKVTLTNRFWGTVAAVFVCGAFGYGFYAVSPPRGQVAMLAGVVAGVVLTANHYAAREATDGRD